MDYYDEYFDMQMGGARTGYGGISHVYIGSPNQRGHGIGSFLGGLFRRIIPLLKRGARAVGKEALRSGINAANDIMETGMHPKEAFKTRLRESGENLKRKAEEKIETLMQGSGYKRAKINQLLHSFGNSASQRIGVKKKKKKKKSRKATGSRKRSGGVKKKRSTRTIATRKNKKTKVGAKRGKKPRTVSDIFV